MYPRLVKLVRNKTPQMVGPGRILFKLVPSQDYLRALEDKLVEEVMEYIRDPSVEELADIYEVITSLAHIRHGGIPNVLDAMEDKRKRLGSLSNGVGLYCEPDKIEETE